MQDPTDSEMLRIELKKNKNLLHVVNRCVCSAKVNVQDAVCIGNKMEADFKDALPSDFYKPIRSKAVTLQSVKKGVNVGDKTVFDVEKLYACMLALIKSETFH